MRKMFFMRFGMLTLGFLTSITVYGQGLESFYQNYFAHPIQMNVARSGLDGHELVLDYHRSFAGFENSPSVASMYYSGEVGERIGIGAHLGSHQAGYQNVFRAGLSYAYKFDFEDVSVSLGLGTNYMSRNLSGEALNNSSVQQDDPLLRELADGVQFFDISLGAHIDYKEFEFGLSFPNAFNTRIDDALTVDGEDDANSFNLTVAYVGYEWVFPDHNFTLKPSFYLISGKNFLTEIQGDAKSAVDLNCLMSLDEDKLMGGVSQRFAGDNSATTVLVGTKIQNISLFYTYGIGYSEFQRYASGTHEISFLIDIK